MKCIHQLFLNKHKYHNIINKDVYKNINFIFMVSLLIHLVFITNFLLNHDSCVLINNNFNWLITQGKWFVTPLASLYGSIHVFYISSVLGLYIYTISAYILCLIFGISNTFLVRLVGVLVLSFPSVATILSYQALDYFSCAFLLSVLSTFFIIKGNKKGICLGCVLLVLSIGAYQPFLGVALSILFIDILLKIIDGKYPRILFKFLLKYISIASVSVVLYYLILKVIVYIKQITISSYRGMDKVTEIFEPEIFIRSFVGCYYDIFTYFINDSLGLKSQTAYLPNIIFIMLILIINYYFYKINIINKIRYAVCMLMLLLIIPVSSNISGLISQNKTFYYISNNSIIILYLVPLILINKLLHIKQNKTNKFLYYATTVISIFFILSWCIRSNIFYQNLMLLNKEYDSKLTVLCSRIQSVDGYCENDKILLIGDPPYKFLDSNGMLKAIESRYRFVSMGLKKSNKECFSSGIIAAYITNKLSYNNSFIVLGDVSDINIETLKKYPEHGSIKRINNIIVIRL